MGVRTFFSVASEKRASITQQDGEFQRSRLSSWRHLWAADRQQFEYEKNGSRDAVSMTTHPRGSSETRDVAIGWQADAAYIVHFSLPSEEPCGCLHCADYLRPTLPSTQRPPMAQTSAFLLELPTFCFSSSRDGIFGVISLEDGKTASSERAKLLKFARHVHLDETRLYESYERIDKRPAVSRCCCAAVLHCTFTRVWDGEAEAWRQTGRMLRPRICCLHPAFSLTQHCTVYSRHRALFSALFSALLSALYLSQPASSCDGSARAASRVRPFRLQSPLCSCAVTRATARTSERLALGQA